MAHTARELDVWQAYLGSAEKLPLMADHPEEALALKGARASLAEGKTTGVLAAAKAALKVCIPDPMAHPVRQGEVRAAARNLEAVIEDLGDRPDHGKSKAQTAGRVDHTVGEGHPGKSEGHANERSAKAKTAKVDCPCGKRHAEGSKVLAKHQAAATN